MQRDNGVWLDLKQKIQLINNQLCLCLCVVYVLCLSGGGMHRRQRGAFSVLVSNSVSHFLDTRSLTEPRARLEGFSCLRLPSLGLGACSSTLVFSHEFWGFGFESSYSNPLTYLPVLRMCLLILDTEPRALSIFCFKKSCVSYCKQDTGEGQRIFFSLSPFSLSFPLSLSFSPSFPFKKQCQSAPYD